MKKQLLTFQKKNLGPVHLLTKTDKWAFLQCPIIEKKMFLVLTSGKFLEALGSGIGTGLVFCHSFSVSNNVYPDSPISPTTTKVQDLLSV